MNTRSYLGLILLALSMAAGSVQAQTYTVLHSFSNMYPNATGPGGGLIQSGNLLYGMTENGGSIGSSGTIFSFNTSTNKETVLHSFGANGDGDYPYSSLVQSGNMLYGAVSNGGSTGQGVIFSFDTSTNQETILHNFGDTEGHTSPWLIQSGNILYGTTTGITSTIYAFDTSTNKQSVLYSFPFTGGSSPQGPLMQSGNTLYGMTNTAIYAFDTGTNKYTTLYTLSSNYTIDGSNPCGALIQSGNILYGLTSRGGPGRNGVIFSFDTSSSKYTVLYSFSGGADGTTPCGSMTMSGNMLYGATIEGGSSGYGTLFSFNTSTDHLETLHSFSKTDGSYPNGDLLCVGNTLYGMTFEGGATYGGVIFSMTVPEPAAMSLLAIGGLAMLRRRKQQKKI